MRILFASANAYIPEFSGGVQSSTDHLVRALMANGHSAAVLSSLFGDGLFGLKTRIKLKLGNRPVAVDHQQGYPVMRAWFPWEAANHAMDSFQPDVAVVQCHQSVRIAQPFMDRG
ncbi:MAG: glycosyl transferase family 1, partial [Pseudomonadota bacterium]